MPQTATINPAIVQQWITNNLTQQAIEADLYVKGLDVNHVSAYLAAFKKHRNTKRQFKGFFCMGIGAFLGFVSCVLALLTFFPNRITGYYMGLRQ
jgi:hypothetical protein